MENGFKSVHYFNVMISKLFEILLRHTETQSTLDTERSGPWTQGRVAPAAPASLAGGGATSLPRALDEQDVGKSAAAALGQRVVGAQRIEDLEQVLV